MRGFFKFLLQFFNLKALVTNLVRHREVIRILTWRDFVSRYRGSIGGVLWPILQPLLLMIIYTLVFSTFLKVRFGSNDSPFNFAVYLLCGLLPWNAFSEGLSQSANLIRSNHNLVKRVVFPLEILPINVTLVTLIQQLIGLCLLFPLAILITGNVSFSVLFLPVVLLFQFMLLTGINWFWTMLSVYIPDVRHLTPLFLMVFMFITPIFYPSSMIPAQARFLVELNPMARLIDIYRSIFMEGVLPDPVAMLITFTVCVFVFLLGYFWFSRSKASFSDLL